MLWSGSVKLLPLFLFRVSWSLSAFSVSVWRVMIRICNTAFSVCVLRVMIRMWIRCRLCGDPLLFTFSSIEMHLMRAHADITIKDYKVRPLTLRLHTYSTGTRYLLFGTQTFRCFCVPMENQALLKYHICFIRSTTVKTLHGGVPKCNDYRKMLPGIYWVLTIPYPKFYLLCLRYP